MKKRPFSSETLFSEQPNNIYFRKTLWIQKYEHDMNI